MTSNNDQNASDDNQNSNKRKSLTPTIGEAVKEAIETGKEVVMAGPTEAGDTTGAKDDDALQTSGLGQGSEGPDRGIVLSPDDSDSSKIAINVKDPSLDSSLVEDKVIVNPEGVKENEEASIAAVTTIPADEGIEVEVQTELEVPVEDKDKDVESELKVRVTSPTLSKEVPLSPQQQQQQEQQQEQRISPSASSAENESASTSFNNRENQGPSDKYSKNKDDAEMNTDKATGFTSPHSQSIEEVQEQTFQVSRDIVNNYKVYQKQLINSFQSMFAPYFGNSNFVWDNQAYLDRLSEIYSRIGIIYTENAIALNRMVSDVTFANIEAFKNFVYNSKERQE
jgi:hypothetical protein